MLAIASRRRVIEKENSKVAMKPLAGRRIATHVRHVARDDERINSVFTESGLQVCLRERTRIVLDHSDVLRTRVQPCVKVKTVSAGNKDAALGLSYGMLHVDDGRSRSLANVDGLNDVSQCSLAVGNRPLAVEVFILDVNHEKRSSVRIERHGRVSGLLLKTVPSLAALA